MRHNRFWHFYIAYYLKQRQWDIEKNSYRIEQGVLVIMKIERFFAYIDRFTSLKDFFIHFQWLIQCNNPYSLFGESKSLKLKNLSKGPTKSFKTSCGHYWTHLELGTVESQFGEISKQSHPSDAGCVSRTCLDLLPSLMQMVQRTKIERGKIFSKIDKQTLYWQDP